jgi:hypothetical protein
MEVQVPLPLGCQTCKYMTKDQFYKSLNGSN